MTTFSLQELASLLKFDEEYNKKNQEKTNMQ